MPVGDILDNVLCEINDTLFDIKLKSELSKYFSVEEWGIGIQLTPKVENDTSVSLGYTGKSISPTAKTNWYWTWTGGTAPGLKYDVKTHIDASVKYTSTTKKLLAAKSYKRCGPKPEGQSPLVNHLGFQEWLIRLIEANAATGKLTSLDAPTFNSQIVATFTGFGGSASYFMPRGSITPNATGSHFHDITVAITLSSQPAKKPVRTLPSAEVGGTSPGLFSSEELQPSTRQKIDQQLFENSLRNLTIRVQ